ncbi:MAG: alkaline phosphatase family protein [Luteolibacter sp.]|uniref:alkaline phosphatase family protein n=1 Tax=Luteolibacter sp. TaxID=1962973 RepID=UPI0032663E8F
MNGRSLFPTAFQGLLAIWCWAAPAFDAVAGEFGNRHVLLFGIDGCRSDALKIAVEKGSAPNIAGLIHTGTVTWTAFAGGELDQPTQQNTVSGPGWSSIFTGVWANKHGVTDNSFHGENFSRYPNLFDHLHQSHPAARFVSLVSWPPIHENLIGPSPEDGRTAIVRHTWPHENPVEQEKPLIAETIQTISNGDPDIVFCYQGQVDTAGHQHGFSPDVPEYMDAIHLTDARIGEVLTAVRQRQSFASENWLLIVATDHGGSGTKHGGQSPEERTIPLIVSGGDVAKGVVSKEIIGQTCIPATVFHHLQVDVPASWTWEAKAFPETAH